MPQTMKQVCVFSATYPKNLEEILKNFMCEPTLLRLNVDEEQLIGIREYCVLCDTFKKADGLMELLKNLVFNQCIIFCETIEM
jgi:superfamily II DNA/RNA helicase